MSHQIISSASEDFLEKGRYIIMHKIAEGNSGIVFKALDKLSKTYVVIKEQDMTKNCFNELRCLRKLNHKHISKYICHWFNGMKCYIVMEYGDGCDLISYLKHNIRIPEDDLRIMFFQIVSAIKYAHELGYCNRDIKLDNIVIADHGSKILIIDWGFGAKGKRLLHDFPGSYHYASPEILGGVPYLGFLSDVWSIGITFYVLSHHKMPYDPPDATNMLMSICMQTVDYNANLNPDLLDLLAGMLARNAALRFTIDEVINHRWFHSLNEPILLPLDGSDMFSYYKNSVTKSVSLDSDVSSSPNSSRLIEMNRCSSSQQTMNTENRNHNCNNYIDDSDPINSPIILDDSPIVNIRTKKPGLIGQLRNWRKKYN